MKNVKNIIKNKLKEEKGFTMQDLIVALVLLGVFVGVISTFMHNSFKVNTQTKLMGQATNYAVYILEDIDKIAYEDVTPELANVYRAKLGIVPAYGINLEVSEDTTSSNGKGRIKKVKLTVSYTFGDETEEIVIQRVKVKEA